MNEEYLLLRKAAEANAEALRMADTDKTFRLKMPEILAATALNFILIDIAYELKEIRNTLNRGR